MNSMVCSVVLACVVNGAAGPAAVWSPRDENGLSLVTVPDGESKRCTLEGREAIELVAAGRYVYFRVSEEVKQRLGSKMFVFVEFLDRGFGRAALQYNAAGNAYAHGDGFVLVNSGKWAGSILEISGMELKGLQNGGADFRFAFPNAGAVARVELYAERPAIDVPKDVQRVEEMVKGIPQHRPQGMYYTFGNDADEASGLLYRALGVTSIESYVTWETCEGAGLDEWNWERWDRQVEVLQSTGLKWVPFLILGPAYSTPGWFRAGPEHVPCRCLEHETDSKIESLWNPNLPGWIDRFLGAFAERYRETGVIESVLLGIQGDFGEAIYSVTGGGWTFNIPGEYHNHPGFWCGDPYALSDFRGYMRDRYRSLRKLNAAWGTDFGSWGAVEMPGRGEGLEAFRKRLAQGEPGDRRRWLDFVDWYRDSMTDFADWWMEVTRKHFPDAPIYLCTGGHAPPEHGSNFAEQCRVAAKHGAGVRITNEGSNYPGNFSVTRWVAAAGKHYGAYYGFEPAGPEDEQGIVVRIYNATASGANQLHDYNPNVVSSDSRVEAQQRHLQYLFHVAEPVVPVALWYPNVSLSLQWDDFLHQAGRLRDLTDFDYVDESMLRTKALDRYRVLVVVRGPVLETKDARTIAAWIRRGGRMIVVDVPWFESVEAAPKPEHILFGDTPEGRTLGKGRVERVADWAALPEALAGVLEQLGLPVMDLREDGVFGTQIEENRFLFLNTSEEDVVEEIRQSGRSHQATVPAGTIADIRMPE